jgi:uncharacterized membrane protein YvbJ
MALINCPECDKQISDQSAHCLHCGYPIAAGDPTSSQESAVTTQLTAKKFKAVMVIGGLLFWIGLITTFTSGGHSAAIIALIVGILLYTGAKTQAWWHNG